MNKKIIDDVVSYIPFKKLREKIKLLLNDFDNSISESIKASNRAFNAVRAVTPQIYISVIEVDIADHCNLNCYSCLHFSQLAKEKYYDIEVFEKDMKRLSELTGGWVGVFHIMGGEPLLNKNCKDYFYIARKYFKHSQLWLVTNGILLKQQNEDFWKACKDNNVEIRPTKYPININWEEIKELCHKNDVYFAFYNDENEPKESWKTLLSIAGQCAPNVSFLHCSIANTCVGLRDGKLSTCGVPLYVERFNQYFDKNLIVTEKDYIDIYKANSYKEVLEQLAKPIPFCRYCETRKWESIGKWAISTRDIKEYC